MTLRALLGLSALALTTTGCIIEPNDLQETPDAGPVCLAIPVCEAGWEEVEACPADRDCQAHSLCDTTILCVPIIECALYPTCDEGDVEREAPCDPEVDDDCYSVRACGSTVYCDPVGQCEAEPTCEPWEVAGDVACQVDEWGCRRVTLCGSTLYCREDPCAQGGAAPAPDEGAEYEPERDSDAIACP